MANAEDGHSEAEYVVRRLTASKKGARIQPRLSKSVPKSSPKAAGKPGLSFSVLEAIKRFSASALVTVRAGKLCPGVQHDSHPYFVQVTLTDHSIKNST